MGYLWNTNKETKKAYPITFQDGDQVEDDWVGNIHRDTSNDRLERKNVDKITTEHHFCQKESEAELREQGFSYREDKKSKKLFGLF